MEGFDMNMDFNMEDFPDMPSFNNDFNMDGIGNLADDDLADFRDISEEENHLGQQDSEESSGNESKTACTEVDEDGSSGEQEIMSDGSITPYETLFDESDNDNGHLPDVENEEDTSLSSQERENSNILDKNQKLLAILSQRKTEAFYKLPKRKDSEDSSLSQEGELISQKPQKSSMKRTNKKGLRSKEKKNVEFALPKESLRKLRYGQDGRAQTEVEAQAHDYFEQKKFPRMNFDVYRHRRNQQGKLSNEIH
ncbi:unnamed protein product [Oikopleura dioica]|uniref:Uncharacterized protein n=1 Tax=Oikopleura dioica TaxID=34765 RepID=E4X0V1_OIKDI|nr:unnamed protein product [Oikopleura dioica]